MIYISKLFSPISTGTSAGDIDVGATVKINENGQPVDYLIVHQGLPSSMYDVSCEGTWCLRKDIAENRQWDSKDVNDYENSTVNAYLNGAWLDRYDPAVAESIIQAKIPYVDGSGNSPVASGASGLSVKAFLLGWYELGFTQSDITYSPADGAKLSYFESGLGSTANNKRIAKLNGANAKWHTRAPYMYNASSCFIIGTNGVFEPYPCTASLGIRPCIILPYDFKFQEVS